MLPQQRMFFEYSYRMQEKIMNEGFDKLDIEFVIYDEVETFRHYGDP